MTDAQLTDLLTTYGDALESACRAPGGATPVTFEPLITPLHGTTDPLDHMEPIANDSPRRGSRLVVAASVIFLAGVAAFGAWTGLRNDPSLRTTDTPEATEVNDTAEAIETPDAIGQVLDIPTELQPFVFPGEIVLRTVPLVVIAAPPEELSFDTSELGTEITFDPVGSLLPDQLDSLIDDALEEYKLNIPGRAPFTQRKLTLLWVEGELLGALSIADTVITATYSCCPSPSDLLSVSQRESQTVKASAAGTLSTSPMTLTASLSHQP